MSTKFFIGICLKRYPYLTKSLNVLESKIDAIYKKFEYDKSLLSDFELRKIKEDQLQKTFMENVEKMDNFKFDSEVMTTKENIDIWTKAYQQLDFKKQSSLIIIN